MTYYLSRHHSSIKQHQCLSIEDYLTPEQRQQLYRTIFYSWQRNIDLAVLEMNKRYEGSVDASKVEAAKNNISQRLSNDGNLENGGDTFNLIANGTDHEQGTFNAADSMIKGMDADGDGIISRQEFINDGLENHTEFARALGMENLSDEYRAEISKDFGNAFDALNVVKAKNDKVEGLDRKEMAAYLAKVDDADGQDGKINYSAKSIFYDALSMGNQNNKNIMAQWYDAIFKKGQDDGVPKAE